MDCKTADEYINLYIDDILGKEETEELFSHIASCRKCSRELQYAFELKNGMSGMGELEPPLGLAQSAIKKARRRRIPFYAYISAGVAAVVVAAVLLSASFSGIQNNTAASIAENDTSANQKMMVPAAMTPAPAPSLAYSAEYAPEASAAPAASAAEGAGGLSISNALKSQQDVAQPEYIYNVPAELTESFITALNEFFNENGIQPDTFTDENNNDVIAFTIPAANLEELKKLIKKAPIPHQDIGEPTAGSYVEFTFEQ